jgi:hypothetical protein
LIISLDELDVSKSKASSHRKRKIVTVSEVSEEKRPRVEQGIALILIAPLIVPKRNSRFSPNPTHPIKE